MIGPFPATAVLIAAAAVLAWVVARFLPRRTPSETRKRAASLLFDTFLVGVVAARAGYILRWWPDYAATPSSLFAIGDGGFYAWVGIPVGVLFAAWRTRGTRKAPRRPMLAGLAAGLVAWTIAQGVWALLLPPPVPLPTQALQTPDGGTLALSEYAGQPVVVNLWASWCPPCQREMPVLAEAQARYPGLRIVLVNQGEDRATAAQFLQAQQLTFEHWLLDPHSTTSRATRAVGLPTTLFFDARGQLVQSHLGELTAARLRDIVQRHFPTATHRIP